MICSSILLSADDGQAQISDVGIAQVPDASSFMTLTQSNIRFAAETTDMKRGDRYQPKKKETRNDGGRTAHRVQLATPS
jgi:hypothetical protein